MSPLGNYCFDAAVAADDCAASVCMQSTMPRFRALYDTSSHWLTSIAPSPSSSLRTYCDVIAAGCGKGVIVIAAVGNDSDDVRGLLPALSPSAALATSGECQPGTSRQCAMDFFVLYPSR